MQKNFYDTAIQIAEDLQFDNKDLASIYKLNGDHLYIKGDYSRAVERYVKTIGSVEPSYVITKFQDSRYCKHLVDYIKALQTQNHASLEHKTMLINCRRKLNVHQKLEDFLFIDVGDSNEMKFGNQPIQNKSVATNNYEDNEEQKEEHNISELLKKIKNTSEMISMLSKLSEDEVYAFFKKFGLILMKKAPKETVRLLKKICSEQEMLNFFGGQVQIIFSPDWFIPLFEANWELLLGFLESCVKNESSKFNESTFNTLIELNLKKWARSMLTDNQLLDILKLHRPKYNKDQVLVMCRMAQFWSGVLYIYEEDQLFNLTIHCYVKNKDYNSLLSYCNCLGQFHPHLWIQALNQLHNDPDVPMNILLQILNVITTKNLQSPLQIVQCLAGERRLNISHVKDCYTQAILKETTAIDQDDMEVQNLQADFKCLQELLYTFQTNTIEFQNTICDACDQRLTFPAFYFLCQHSFHQSCLRNDSENDNDCSICSVINQQMIEKLGGPQESHGQHENFHQLLNQSNDTLNFLSSHFGRGLFNQIVVEDELKEDKVHYEEQRRIEGSISD